MSEDRTPVEAPWSRPATDVAQALGVDLGRGLTVVEAQARLRRHGPNRLREPERRPAWKTLLHQLTNLIVGLLLAAALVAFAFGETVEALAILVVLGVNTAIGFFSEHHAVRSMESLHRLIRVDVAVRREGVPQVIPAEHLVPGDVVIVTGGDVITADLRLTEASKLQADESALTGESAPIAKSIEPVDAGTALADRADMLYSGTAVTRGSGEGVVVATGLDTELGRISSLVQAAEPGVTPLRRHLDALGRRLVWVTLAVATLVGVAAFWAGKPLLLLIETSIALAVAAVPEGLPIVVTIAQARGMWRMARRNALIERLSAVETLGSTGVILTDKTGTLTENRMTVTRIVLDSGEVRVGGGGLRLDGGFGRDGQALRPEDDALLLLALRVGALCNNAAVALHEGSAVLDVVGDPMEAALVIAAEKAGLGRRDLLRQAPELREVAFDPDLKLMATYHQDGDEVLVAAKGAPEALLEASSTIATAAGPRPLTAAAREHWLAINEAMARNGLRVLGVAMKHVETVDAEPYASLMFVGLMGLMDPPRSDVARALGACRRAGIRVVMVTGDQAPTAQNVAAAVGLTADGAEVLNGPDLPPLQELRGDARARVLNAAIVARATPEQKLDLIALHQQAGEIVAMTGDGVNDAPALRKADIGVAMGLRGTQVAREAAAMVLKDDAFGTIVAAVEQGRVIFANIRKFVLYLLSCNASEILVVGLAALARAPLPILPLQILFLNLVTDVFPALALGVGEGSREIMERPPRDPREPILTPDRWWAVAGYGMVITIVVLLALLLALRGLGLDPQHAVTISFLTLAFSQLWHVFNMRERGSRLLRNEVTRNPWVWGALALCVGLLLAAIYVPGLARVLDVIEPTRTEWGLILGLSIVPTLVGQLAKAIGGAGRVFFSRSSEGES